MIELDEAMRQALLARDGPPPGTSEQILASLRVRLAAPSPSGPGDGGAEALGGDAAVESVAQAGRAAWAAKVVGATVALTGGGLLVLKLGAMTVAAIGGNAPPAEDRTQLQVQDQLDMREPPGLLDEPAVESMSSSEASGDSNAANAADTSGTPSYQRSSAMVPTKLDGAGPGSDLAAEIALVHDAKRLRETAPQAALNKLDQHRAQFPGGTLAPERDALRVELLCALDRVSEAGAAREQFPLAHPGSPLLPRVKKICVGTDPGDAGD